MLDKEFQYYVDSQSEIVKKYNDRFIVITSEDVVGNYESYEQACFKSSLF